MTSDNSPMAIRVSDELKDALDAEADEAGLSRSEYLRQILSNRDGVTQTATDPVTTEQLHAQTETILSQFENLAARLRTDGITTLPDTRDQQAVLDELVQRNVAVPVLNERYGEFVNYALDHIAEMPNKRLQEQAIDLFEAVLPRIRSPGPLYYQQTIIPLIHAQTETADAEYLFGRVVWPWLHQLWVQESITITPEDGDLRIE